jgi:hypothetical protein
MNSGYYIYIVLGVVIVLAIFVLISYLFPTPEWKTDIIKKLNEISRLSSSREPLILSSLLVEADKLLDYTLKKRGIEGTTLATRLKNAKGYYKKNEYSQIRVAHKLRNQVAHENDFTLSISEAHQAIRVLLSAVRKLVE